VGVVALIVMWTGKLVLFETILLSYFNTSLEVITFNLHHRFEKTADYLIMLIFIEWPGVICYHKVDGCSA